MLSHVNPQLIDGLCGFTAVVSAHIRTHYSQDHIEPIIPCIQRGYMQGRSMHAAVKNLHGRWLIGGACR
jgi:hypothetical protein